MSSSVEIYDVTLRDGAQGPRIKFSSDNQIRIVRELDALGISYIEGGQPGSNPKAAELFSRAKDMQLKHAKMTSFGSTRHPKQAVEDDPNLKALLASGTEVITIFAKSSATHAMEVLRVSLDDNLKLIQESVSYLRAQNRRVFFDAEHFFDGYKEDPSYALLTLSTAYESGSEVLVLCDTNGGCLPWEIAEITHAVRLHLPHVQLGIHAHNDSGCAVANTISSVHSGASQIQGTINGYGERTGNANLISVIADLQLKMNIPVIDEVQLSRLTHLSHIVAEYANISPRDSDPYVGRDAFTHKGGMHADAVNKYKASYEHICPELVGNHTTISVSEMSGRSSLLQKAAELGVLLERDDPATLLVLSRVKELENEGYEFEAADASLHLLMLRAQGKHHSFFSLCDFRVSVTSHPNSSGLSEATVKVLLPDTSLMHTVAEGSTLR